MEVNEIEVIIVSAEKEGGNKQDCIVIPEAEERTDFLECAVGKFVTDYLFDSRGKGIVTVKWGHVFKIEE